MQEGKIFSESIARNIAVDDSDVDDARLYQAATIANLNKYIGTLPMRYETMIGGDGRGLSMGQKQRILIARAVYKSPEFLFLDEATNSLDATNEQQIVNNLDDFFIGKTVLLIAHRLSTVRKADKILVMDSGRIVEMGTHDTLVFPKRILLSSDKKSIRVMKEEKMQQVELHEAKMQRLMDLHLVGVLKYGTVVISLTMLLVIGWLLHLLGKV